MSIERVPIDPDFGEAVVLDQDHYYVLYGADGHDQPVGALVYHRLESGHWCGGGVQWTPTGNPHRGALWELHSLRPLHVEPSIKCLHEPDGRTPHADDGMVHGYIRGDVWVPHGSIPAWAL